MAPYPRGIDVSNNNGWVDWDAVAASGIGFAICKASEGTWFRDGWFSEFWTACKRVGLARGAYHFARPSECSPEAEADYFLEAISLLYGPLEAGDVLALDLEDPYASGDLSGWTLTWLQRVEAACGYKPLVYTSPSYAQAHHLSRLPAIGQYGLWLASWGVPTPPPPPSPWSLVAVHQVGVAPAGVVAGVSGECDVNNFNGSSVDQFKLYGKPAGDIAEPEPEPEPEPPPAGLPEYDWQEPAHAQEEDWDCSQESAEWMLWSYQREPDGEWMEASMQAAGVINPSVGLTDATGAGLAAWLNAEYGEFGYAASNEASVTFDQVAAEAAQHKHPLMVGGRAWSHWSGVRSGSGDTLQLANPAAGYLGVWQTMSRAQWDSLGPFSMVRLTHPQAEQEVQPGPEPPPTTTIGSGLLEMMAADNTRPAMTSSVTFGQPWQVEMAWGENGTLYAWLLGPNKGFRYSPES